MLCQAYTSLLEYHFITIHCFLIPFSSIINIFILNKRGTLHKKSFVLAGLLVPILLSTRHWSRTATQYSPNIFFNKKKIILFLLNFVNRINHLFLFDKIVFSTTKGHPYGIPNIFKDLS